jgi:AcrR family transcriptional regulator
MATESAVSPTSGRPLRRHAQRNRDAVLAAAQLAFARHGLHVPLEWIAKDADVGIGTLYRNFPTRNDLIEAVVAEKLTEWMATAQRAVEFADPWEGLVFYLEELCARQAEDRGFTDLVSMRFPDLEDLREDLLRIQDLSDQVTTRARDAGHLRADVVTEDLALITWGLSRVVEVTHPVRPDIWRRYLGLLLDSLRPANAHPLPVAPMLPLEVAKAMALQGNPPPTQTLA